MENREDRDAGVARAERYEKLEEILKGMLTAVRFMTEEQLYGGEVEFAINFATMEIEKLYPEYSRPYDPAHDCKDHCVMCKSRKF